MLAYPRTARRTSSPCHDRQATADLIYGHFSKPQLLILLGLLVAREEQKGGLGRTHLFLHDLLEGGQRKHLGLLQAQFGLVLLQQRCLRALAAAPDCLGIILQRTVKYTAGQTVQQL